MAIVRMTMEEIRKEMTPERMALEAERLRNHVDEYDPENPPLTGEELKRFRPYKEVEYERKLIDRYRNNDNSLSISERNKAEQILLEREERRIALFGKASA